jgi:hypothetical protein
MAGMGLTLGGTVAAEDIRHLQRAAHGEAGYLSSQASSMRQPL